MINYIIIDDEHIAHDIIKNYCDLASNMQLKKHCYDALEALDYLRENTIDLIFLDLNMPKLKGFDFLRTLSNPPKVIVTTAYKEYALEGYELEIVDYLLKPFSFERFLKAVNKAVISQKEKTIKIEHSDSNEGKHMFFYSNKQYVQVKINEILYVEAAGNYSKVTLKEKKILVREKISKIVEKLPQKYFMQVHKSFIVAKNSIDSVEGNRIKILENIIPIGKLYKNNITSLLN